MTMRAMILAAGRGERMRPLTDTCPKPLLPVAGQPLIGWHLNRLAAAGIRDIVINHAWLGHLIEARLGDGRQWGVSIRYSAEGVALETAGGIAQALPLLGDAPFLVINGDVFCDWDPAHAAAIAARMRTDRLDAWCVLVPNPPHHPRGDFALQGDRLRNEGGDGPRLTFSGLGVYHPRLFDGLAPGSRAPLAPRLREAADHGRAGAERFDGRWVDVGTPQRLAQLDAQLRASPSDPSGAR